MSDKPETVLQYVHRSNRRIGHTLLQIEARTAREIELSRHMEEIQRGLELARIRLDRCGPHPNPCGGMPAAGTGRPRAPRRAPDGPP